MALSTAIWVRLATAAGRTVVLLTICRPVLQLSSDPILCLHLFSRQTPHQGQAIGPSDGCAARRTAASCCGFLTAQPANAQEYRLFDKFSLRADASFVVLKTQIRLDSETLGQGTMLNFEDDLNIDSSKVVPSFDFTWQIARRHRLGVRWQKIDRGSSAQALTEIQWGGEIIPVDADITLAFDIKQAFLEYTYFPWVNERWAAGFGLALRVMDIFAELTWSEGNAGICGTEAAEQTGRLPYLYFEYRRMFSERWRFVTGLGWLYVEVGDIDGGQWKASASIEYLLGEHWGFGGSLNLSAIDVGG